MARRSMILVAVAACMLVPIQALAQLEVLGTDTLGRRLIYDAGPYAPLTYTGDGYAGWNITTSDLGHLFYEALGNEGRYVAYGVGSGCGDTGEPSCFVNADPFQALTGVEYWSVDHAAIAQYAWYFTFTQGGQYVDTKVNAKSAIAVHDGRAVAAAVPAAGTSFGHLKSLYR